MAAGAGERNWGEGLTEKEVAFVDAFFACQCNQAAAAARRAGYEQPKKQGWQVFHRPQVQEAMRKVWKADGMPAGEAVARLTAQARGSLGDCVSSDGNGGWKLDLETAEETGAVGLIQELSTTSNGHRVKMYSSQRALEAIAKFHGLQKGTLAEENSNSQELPQHFLDALDKVFGPKNGNPTGAAALTHEDTKSERHKEGPDAGAGGEMREAGCQRLEPGGVRAVNGQQSAVSNSEQGRELREGGDAATVSSRPLEGSGWDERGENSDRSDRSGKLDDRVGGQTREARGEGFAGGKVGTARVEGEMREAGCQRLETEGAAGVPGRRLGVSALGERRGNSDVSDVSVGSDRSDKLDDRVGGKTREARGEGFAGVRVETARVGGEMREAGYETLEPGGVGAVSSPSSVDRSGAAGVRVGAVRMPAAGVRHGVSQADGVRRAAADPFAGLTEGRVVHYVLPDGPQEDAHRGAVVTSTGCRDGMRKLARGIVNLAVITDPDDRGKYCSPVLQRRSVEYSAELKRGTWHWIELDAGS